MYGLLLVVDVGNTNTVVGVYSDDELAGHWRLSTNRQRTADEWGILLRDLFGFHSFRFQDVEGVIISSVVPQLMLSLERMSLGYFNVQPLIIGPGMKTGMPIRYDNPREIGADRIVNAVAGFRKYGGPLVIVDFGTATTFDAVSADGEYLGGAISPGLVVATEALFERTAKLPRVEFVSPKSAIGKNTVSSIQSGIVFGFVGLVDGLVRRICRELGGKVHVVATGGLAELLAEHSTTINDVDQFLTLDGLRLLYELNRVQPDEECVDGE